MTPPLQRARHPQRVAEILSPLIGSLTVAKRPSEDEVRRLWRRLIGAQAARHSCPTSLRRGELLVSVDSSVWLWNLSLERRRLLTALQAEWGADTVTGIRLQIHPPPTHRQ